MPSDGLLVQGGLVQPTAFSALSYSLPDGASVGQLVLRIAPGTLSTPAGSLRICPLTSGFVPAQGASAGAPTYDCGRSVTAAVANGGLVADIGSLLQGDELDIALLPASGTERFVLTRPAEDSLEVTQPTTPPGDQGSSDFDDDGFDDAGEPPAVDDFGSTAVVDEPDGVAPVPTADDEAAVAPTGESGNEAAVAASASTDKPSARSPLGLVVLVATAMAAVGLWAAAGSGVAARTSQPRLEGGDGGRD